MAPRKVDSARGFASDGAEDCTLPSWRVQSRHRKWYHRHRAASRARSALRVWALRNRTRELVESGLALGSICLPKELMLAPVR